MKLFRIDDDGDKRTAIIQKSSVSVYAWAAAEQWALMRPQKRAPWFVHPQCQWSQSHSIPGPCHDRRKRRQSMTTKPIIIQRVPVTCVDASPSRCPIIWRRAASKSGSTGSADSWERISKALTNLIVCYYVHNSFPYTLDWAGSTVELSPDADADVDGLRRHMHRVMEKNGNENVVFRRIPEKSWRYMRDVITTLVRFMFGHKHHASKTNTMADRSNIYSITPSIQQRLDELARESPKERMAKPIPHIKPNLDATPNQIEEERVKFRI